MANLFSPSSFPSGLPATLVAGDFWAWTRDLPDYGAGYSLVYELTPIAGGTPVEIAAPAPVGYLYTVEIDSTASAEYAAGEYQWWEMMQRDSDGARIRIGYGRLTIKPDPATSTSDTRTHAARTLAAIEAVIEGRATIDQQSYSIAGRSLQRTPLADLLMLRDKYAADVSRETIAENIAAGTGRRNRNIKVRMA